MNSSALREYLFQTFENAGGEISFEEFMRQALYHPEFGYYTAQIGTVGESRGDFATSATLSKALGKAIAAWILAEAEALGWKDSIPVIEIGAGTGELAKTILQTLGWRRWSLLDYRIVDVSGPLEQQQRHKLKWRKVHWHETVAKALKRNDGRAIIISNELVDAFPLKWLRWNAFDHAWDEVFVSYSEATGLCETFHPLPEEYTKQDFSAMGLLGVNNGQRIEILPSYRSFLQEINQHWVGGSMFTVDYGGSPDDIYHRRPAGTMRGYYQNNRVERADVYLRFGRQDLTADVNFRDIRRWGEGLGWKTLRYESQTAFLRHFGQGGDPMAGAGPGVGFRVLHQRKGN